MMILNPESAIQFADEWLPAFLAAHAMTPTHPLRGEAMAAAEQPVRAMFAARHDGAPRATSTQLTLERAALSQVLLVLHAIAANLTADAKDAGYLDPLPILAA